MFRDWFLQILQSLHFADKTQTPKADSADYNKLHILNLAMPKLQQVYKPNRQLATDETLIKFKGKVHLGSAFWASQGDLELKHLHFIWDYTVW